ncbi:uncharacterized protein MONOS_2759 [Monocercomonoides exilis]|uniref:uncharacterized protein n=1 Tax=Monocercomonoides exilis TaxID=2049356 RepID=UPI00355A4358|nr:hypothetical protein MONOS_2759 [Monocercomonoides exilis]|eukprot:MONOS_2759.1-p1 / transcript=MONOS_2759.1 / gene=MONOS_2759 / organism=Monocercomonoides_exilis_PA203 / gene_product=unspecified product / transcript_product=unspecified product / location=Mono_scaffold00059:11993-12256(+) / protein_length=88 / sequence_SO=supercontig / SO=protein_coding / is_pseudo=false
MEGSSSVEEEQNEEDYSLNSKSDNIESRKRSMISKGKKDRQHDNRNQTICNEEEESSLPSLVEEPEEHSNEEDEREVVQKKTIEITI